MLREQPGIIYIFRKTGTDLYKIGFTTKEDPSKSRLPGVQTGNDGDLEFFHMWPGTYGEEQDLHDLLQPFRSRKSGKGEWYHFRLGELIQGISYSQFQLEASESFEGEEFDPHQIPCPIVVSKGVYEGISGFFSELVYVPLSYISETYRVETVHKFDMDEHGNFPACICCLPSVQDELYLPSSVLTKI